MLKYLQLWDGSDGPDVPAGPDRAMDALVDDMVARGLVDWTGGVGDLTVGTGRTGR